MPEAYFPQPSIEHSLVDHIVGQRPHFDKFKRKEVLESMFSDHNRIKL
jgi:hypothetical protein